MQAKTLLRRILLILAKCAFFSVFIFLFILNSFAAGFFNDVPSTQANYSAIKYIQEQKFVDGYPDGTFRPNNPINRAEFTKIITEAYYAGQATGGNCFSDINTEWFAKYVCFDKIHNLISGYPDGSFQPASNINFVEIAKILMTVQDSTIKPNSDIWYKPYVEKLSEAHAIPISITSFSQKVTRGEVAEMIYRLRNNITNKPSKTYAKMLETQANSSLPIRLKIPAINVNVVIEYVGLTPQGAIDVPKKSNNVAWFDLGARPGDNGSAIITGHVNWYAGASGVFANLHKLKPGDKITVQDNQGLLISFVIRESRIYDAAANAIDVFSSSDGKAHLNLITCEGLWNKLSQQYSKRLVVFADKE